MNSTWHEMTAHLRHSWLGEEPGLEQQLEAVSGSISEVEEVLSRYAGEHAAAGRRCCAAQMGKPGRGWKTMACP